MKSIPLTQGKFALVDDADFDELNQYKWCAAKSRDTFYAIRSEWVAVGKRKTTRMHRQIMGSSTCQIDHRDLNGLNNQRSNLRDATHSQNRHNTPLRRTNTTGYKGVYLLPWGTYRAMIGIEGKLQHLGCFDTAEEAAEVRNQKAIDLLGEFARAS